MINEEFKKFAYDLGNVGAEVSRFLNWQKQGETNQSQKALERALGLLDLLIAESQNKLSLKEFLYLREVLCAKVFLPNQYDVTETQLKNYFLSFAILARGGSNSN